jgi:hypothetical protein
LTKADDSEMLLLMRSSAATISGRAPMDTSSASGTRASVPRGTESSLRYTSTELRILELAARIDREANRILGLG